MRSVHTAADRPADEQAFLEETDFDESIIVGLVVGSSGQSTEAAVTHTVAAEAAVQCYVCIRGTGYRGPEISVNGAVPVIDSWNCA